MVFLFEIFEANRFFCFIRFLYEWKKEVYLYWLIRCIGNLSHSIILELVHSIRVYGNVSGNNNINEHKP